MMQVSQSIWGTPQGSEIVADDTVSFEAHILPLFTQKDVSIGEMPPANSGEEPWGPDQVELFSRWMAGGCQP